MKKHFLLGLVFFGGAAMVYIYAIQALDQNSLQMPQAPDAIPYEEITETTVEEPGIEMEESTDDISLPVSLIADVPQTLQVETEEEQPEESMPSVEEQPIEPADESQPGTVDQNQDQTDQGQDQGQNQAPSQEPDQEQVAQQEFGNEPEEDTESYDDEDLNPYL